MFEAHWFQVSQTRHLVPANDYEHLSNRPIAFGEDKSVLRLGKSFQRWTQVPNKCSSRKGTES